MKNLEIERKYLIDFNKLPNTPLGNIPNSDITQGYLIDETSKYSFRIRKRIYYHPALNRPSKEEYYQTIKSKSGDLVRKEFEIMLTETQFNELWPICEISLQKKRYKIELDDGNILELDVFKGNLNGLLMGEVEFNSVESAEDFKPPDWFGKEVTSDIKYSNEFLASINSNSNFTIR